MKTDKTTTEYIDKLKDIKLSVATRARMESDLLSYARFHAVDEGVRVGEHSRSIEQVPQRTSLFTLFNSNLKSMTAAIIAIVLIAGGGTTYAAEGAVPGDFLYPVKVEFNENVKSGLALSNEAEASLQARLAEERLEEAEELAARGSLTATASTDLRTRLHAHFAEAKERSDQAEAAGDYESAAVVRASLEGSLRTYAGVLSSLNANVTGNNGEELISDVRLYADEITQVRATATVEASADVAADTEATIARVDAFITQVETTIARAGATVSAEVHARAEAKLAEAVAVQTDAKASFRTEAYQAAYTATQLALRFASEAQTMINSALRLDLDIDLGSDTEGLLDVRVETDGSAEIRTEASSDTQTTDQSEDARDTNTNASVDLELDVRSDTSVDTDVIDVDAETDTSVRGGLNL